MHYVYRQYGADGTLLYVGCTMDWQSRNYDHRKFKSWWKDVVRIDIERFADRTAAMLSEKNAILNEHPTCNIVHNHYVNGKRKYQPKPKKVISSKASKEATTNGRTK